MKFLMIGLPVFAIFIFVAFKLPSRYKEYFFKVPIWISSTLISFLIGSRLHGVMGPYAALLCDFLLMPLLTVIKKHHDWKMEKDRKKEEKNSPIKKAANTSPIFGF